jgi:predicted nucleotidyltransferase
MTIMANHELIGGIIFGSIIHSRQNMASDVNCLIMYKEADRGAAMLLCQSLHKRAKNLHVPLELILISDIDTDEQCHTLQASLLMHLQKGVIIKTNLLNQIQFSHDRIKDAIDYLAHKKDKWQKRWGKLSCLSDEEYHELLADIIEAPIHIARHILIATHIEMSDDSKNTVISLYNKHYPKEAILLNQLYEINQTYKAIINKEKINLHNYKDLLLKIEQAIGKAVDFTTANQLILNP